MAFINTDIIPSINPEKYTCKSGVTPAEVNYADSPLTLLQIKSNFKDINGHESSLNHPELLLAGLRYSSAITSKALLSFSVWSRAISYKGCAAQMFFFSLFGISKAFFLAMMAYGLFTILCDSGIIFKMTCVCLVAGFYLSSCLNCTIQMGFTFSFSFCEIRKINHFFCNIPAVMQASCSDTFANKRLMLFAGGFSIVSTSLVIISCSYIIATVMWTPSAEGRCRTFSTCISQKVAVSLFFGTVSFTYAQPKAVSSPDQSKVVSVFYTTVIPMLNALIYSLRN
nr:LOW QUALITY PROTEIN: olfactory receptor 12-like [Caretta caretta]